MMCESITDHDIENAEQVGRAKWVCPKCGKDVSLAYVLLSELFDYEPEQ